MAANSRASSCPGSAGCRNSSATTGCAESSDAAAEGRHQSSVRCEILCVARAAFTGGAINAALQARVNRSFTMLHRGLQRLTNRCPFELFMVKHELNYEGVVMLRSVVIGVVTISLSGAASAQPIFATSDPVPETRTTVLAATQ